MISWRTLSEADVASYFEFHPGGTGSEFVSPQEARQAWQLLTKSPAFNGVVVEDTAKQHNKIAGFGASVFVTRAFAEEELRAPRPGLSGRIVAGIVRSEPVVLSAHQLAKGNSGDGLDLAVFCGRWRNEATPEEAKEVQLALAASFAELHVGYYLRRIFIEFVDAQDHFFANTNPIWRIVSHFSRNFQTSLGSKNAEGRSLAVIDREDVLAISGSVIGPLFQRRIPRLGLRESDRALLRAALKHGATDQEIVEELGVSPAAVKRRWAILFDRVESSPLAELFLNGTSSSEGKRGPQRRHKILAYLRLHPEELRPFAE